MKYYLTLIAVIIAISVVKSVQDDIRHKQEISDLQQQLAHAQIQNPVKHDTVMVHDTLMEVATSPVILAELSDLKKQHLIDTELVKAMGLKLKQLEAMQTTTTEVSDSVPAAYDTDRKTWYYSDQWADISFQPTDTTFYYNIRDSLSTYVYREYKHKFLWFRWGTKGYHVKLVNYNPNAHIKYNRFVRPK